MTKLYENMMLSRMLGAWRIGILVKIYKNEGDVQSRSNYLRIKLMSHTINLSEIVIERILRLETEVSENQFEYTFGKSTVEDTKD